MKSIILFCLFVSFYSSAICQPDITGNKGPVKLKDVMAAYDKDMQAVQPDDDNDEEMGTGRLSNLIVKERTNDRYGRWLWYWKQNLDKDGNMVGPARVWKEWQKIKARSGTVAQRTTGNPASWSFQGPDSSGANGSGVGRVNVITFHPTDTNTFWVGSPGGGAWKTTNNGASWTCMTDRLPLLSISDIKINPLNPQTIYLCTGDRDGTDYYGIGLLKSYDGGNTWNTTGLTWTESEYHIANWMLINPLDTNSLTVATSYGILRSFDAGATFTQTAAGSFKQLAYRPNDTNVVFATRYRSSSSSTSTSSQAQIERSSDGGMTWRTVTSFTNAARVTVAVTPANPNIVKAIVATNTGTNVDGLDGIYSSSDTGNTFTEIYAGGCSGTNNLLYSNPNATGCGGQGTYDLTLAISPVDTNLLYLGGVNAWMSKNGGTTWQVLNQWSGYMRGVAVVHADKHFMGFNPLLPNRFFEGNDGGIYSCDNTTASGTWNDLTNGLGIEEFYRVAVSPAAADFVLAGAQDVGTKLVHPGFYEWANGGDGTQCVIDFADSTVAYASSQYGHIKILNPVSALSPVTISSNISGGTVDGTGAWVTPYILQPSCHTCILAGYKQVYRSMDRGNTWASISPALTSINLSRVVTTIQDSNTIYVTDGGSENIFFTHDMGATAWNYIVAPYTGYIPSDIVIDPRDSSHIYVTFNGFDGPHVAEWHGGTTWADAGTWNQVDSGLPNVPVHCITFDYLSRDIYVGTMVGAYYKDSTMTSWAPYNTGMPVVSVTDLEINYRNNEIWAATYGRSLWKSIKNTTTLGESTIPFLTGGLTITPNPSYGTFRLTARNLANKQVAVNIVDLAGKIVWNKNGTMNASAQWTIITSGLKPGDYLVEITSEGAVYGRTKVVIY